uniref:Uncharacterized protein n=1 Tax=Lactuca sativa TaxID=4236 RepID=A0A9R1WDK8_LACSA|nr:hypothetical protein LSAT_V11C200055000 [Lactuca sativa]
MCCDLNHPYRYILPSFLFKSSKLMTSFSYNDHEESFTKLPIYLYNIQHTNPHSYTYIETNVLDRFELCLVTIRCVVICVVQNIKDINAFLGCMLLVIFIGSVRIRGEYLIAMFVGVAMDENNSIMPIAFGIRVMLTLVPGSLRG